VRADASPYPVFLHSLFDSEKTQMRVVIFRPSFFELAFWALISEIQLPRFRVRIVYSYTKTLEQGCVFAKHEARGGEPRTAKEETYQQCACTPPTSRSISYSCNLFRVANFTLPVLVKVEAGTDYYFFAT
jgi:hypothetical protein